MSDIKIKDLIEAAGHPDVPLDHQQQYARIATARTLYRIADTLSGILWALVVISILIAVRG